MRTADRNAFTDQLHMDLDEFEARYAMYSKAFYGRFRIGEMGDAMDFMEWPHYMTCTPEL